MGKLFSKVVCSTCVKMHLGKKGYQICILLCHIVHLIFSVIALSVVISLCACIFIGKIVYHTIIQRRRIRQLNLSKDMSFIETPPMTLTIEESERETSFNNIPMSFILNEEEEEEVVFSIIPPHNHLTRFQKNKQIIT